MTPAEFKAALHEGLGRHVGEPRPDDLVFTFVGKSARGLGVRPLILEHAQDGTKVYGLTRKQAEKLLQRLS